MEALHGNSSGMNSISSLIQPTPPPIVQPNAPISGTHPSSPLRNNTITHPHPPTTSSIRIHSPFPQDSIQNHPIRKKRHDNYSAILTQLKQNQPLCCCICLDNSKEKIADLIQCAALDCDVCVHRECYGISEMVQDSWYCQKCRTPNKSSVRCCLCPNRGGALKKVSNHKSLWVHLVCALWFPEAKIMDQDGEDIITIEDIPIYRYNQVCCICNKSEGACLNCSAVACNKKIHVTCAQAWDLLEETTDVQNTPNQDPFFVFCKEHGYKDVPEMSAWASWSMQLTKEIEKNTSSLNKAKRFFRFSNPELFSKEWNSNMPILPRANSLDILVEATKQVSSPVVTSSFTQSPNESPYMPQIERNIERMVAAYNQRKNAELFKSKELVNQNEQRIMNLVKQKHELEGGKEAANLMNQSQYQQYQSSQATLNEIQQILMKVVDSGGLHLLADASGNSSMNNKSNSKENVLSAILSAASQDRNFITLPSFSSTNCASCNLSLQNLEGSQCCSRCHKFYHKECIQGNNGTISNGEWICDICNKQGEQGRPVKKAKYSRAAKGERRRTRRGGREFAHPNVHVRYIAPISRPAIANDDANKKMSFSNILSVESVRPEPIEEPIAANQSENDIIISEEFELPEEDNNNPPVSTDLEQKPIPQKPRFKGDLYTPRWIRGVGKQKEGLCPLCKPGPVWCKIKISAFWYHLNYQHGISSITGRPFSPPLEQRINPETKVREGLCHRCREWIVIQSPRSKPVLVEEIYWWKHSQKCHHS